MLEALYAELAKLDLTEQQKRDVIDAYHNALAKQIAAAKQ